VLLFQGKDFIEKMLVILAPGSGDQKRLTILYMKDTRLIITVGHFLPVNKNNFKLLFLNILTNTKDISLHFENNFTLSVLIKFNQS
jgi:hypothetical protein